MSDCEESGHEAVLTEESAISNCARPYLFEPTRPTSTKTKVTALPSDTCICDKCSRTDILSPYSAVCCQRSHRITKKIDSCKRRPVTETSGFKIVCLNEEILKISFQWMIAICKKRKKAVREIFNNCARRWTAYSQFIFWIYGGPLGQSIHEVLTSCVGLHDAIRQKFPSLDGLYTDFCAGDNDKILLDWNVMNCCNVFFLNTTSD